MEKLLLLFGTFASSNDKNYWEVYIYIYKHFLQYYIYFSLTLCIFQYTKHTKMQKFPLKQIKPLRNSKYFIRLKKQN